MKELNSDQLTANITTNLLNDNEFLWMGQPTYSHSDKHKILNFTVIFELA